MTSLFAILRVFDKSRFYWSEARSTREPEARAYARISFMILQKSYGMGTVEGCDCGAWKTVCVCAKVKMIRGDEKDVHFSRQFFAFVCFVLAGKFFVEAIDQREIFFYRMLSAYCIYILWLGRGNIN